MAKKTTYLDHAATTPTPGVVVDAMNTYYQNFRANVHRGVYDSALKATDAYETARAKVAKFINASPDEIVFNSGATFGLNQLAYSLSPRLSHRDNIVLTRSEHHANLIPWQQMAKHYGFEIRFIELNKKTFQLDLQSLSIIDENTKIVCLGLVSNVTGTINPVTSIIKNAKKLNKNIYTIVDAAQAVAHIPVDVKKLGCDFLVFSGHKMYGPTGVGVLYGKKVMLNEHIEPFFFGGEMVSNVTYETAVWNTAPHRFEAGTPNIAGVIGLGAAVDYINKIGFKKIRSHEQKLTTILLKELKKVGATIIGHSACHPERSEGSLKVGKRDSSATPQNDGGCIGVVSFSVPGIHPHDLAEILNQNGIAIRAGYHCAEPLHTYLGITATARASIGIQNTESEIKKLISAIKKARKIFA